MGLLWSIIPTAGETRRERLREAKRANDLKEREVKALEELAKQRSEKVEDWSDDR